jgi:Aldo/keto reductase family
VRIRPILFHIARNFRAITGVRASYFRHSGRMKCRILGTDPATQRRVSVLSLGAMRFGTATDEATSFAILDRYVEADGTFIDTSNNYAWWADDDQGGQSAELLGCGPAR